MSLKEAATREAVLKTLLDAVKAEYDAARAETQTLLDAASQETGTRQVAVGIPNGPDIATVSLSPGEAAARVVDEDAFTAWVVSQGKRFKSEIERKFVTTVRKAFVDQLLKEMTAAGVAQWADKETGELHDVPGVAIAPARARTHNVRFKKTGRETVMAAWREGRLAGVALPELAAGGDE